MIYHDDSWKVHAQEEWPKQCTYHGNFCLVVELWFVNEINGTYTARASYAGENTTSTFVVPEFPLSVLVIMTAVVGMGIAAARFKNPLL